MQRVETNEFPLDFIALCIIAENKETGARNPMITGKILNLIENGFPISKPDIRYSAFGIVSDDIDNTMSLFHGKKYIEQESPAIITEEGVAFLKSQIDEYLSDNLTKEICRNIVKELHLDYLTVTSK